MEVPLYQTNSRFYEPGISHYATELFMAERVSIWGISVQRDEIEPRAETFFRNLWAREYVCDIRGRKVLLKENFDHPQMKVRLASFMATVPGSPLEIIGQTRGLLYEVFVRDVLSSLIPSELKDKYLYVLPPFKYNQGHKISMGGDVLLLERLDEDEFRPVSKLEVKGRRKDSGYIPGKDYRLEVPVVYALLNDLNLMMNTGEVVHLREFVDDVMMTAIALGVYDSRIPFMGISPECYSLLLERLTTRISAGYGIVQEKQRKRDPYNEVEKATIGIQALGL